MESIVFIGVGGQDADTYPKVYGEVCLLPRSSRIHGQECPRALAPPLLPTSEPSRRGGVRVAFLTISRSLLISVPPSGQHAGPPEGHAGSFTQSYRSAGISSWSSRSPLFLCLSWLLQRTVKHGFPRVFITTQSISSQDDTVETRSPSCKGLLWFVKTPACACQLNLNQDKEISPTPLIDLKMTASGSVRSVLRFLYG
eukprot:767600-Hanusia_phi.AAC.3